MEEKAFKPGDAVITQGDEGDNLYVIEEGKLACSRRFVQEIHNVFRQKTKNLNF